MVLWRECVYISCTCSRMNFTKGDVGSVLVENPDDRANAWICRSVRVARTLVGNRTNDFAQKKSLADSARQIGAKSKD